MLDNPNLSSSPSNDIDNFFKLIIDKDPAKINEFKELIRINPAITSTTNNIGLSGIFIAILKKNTLALKAIIENDSKTLDQKNQSGNSPIFYAIFSENIDALNEIISANPETLIQQDNSKRTPIFYAIATSKIDALKAIISSNPETLQQTDKTGKTPIFYAIEKGDIDALNTIISSNPETLQQTDKTGKTPIFYAIEKGGIDALNAIISSNPETLQQTDKTGKTPIFYAIATNKIDALNAIISTNPETLQQKDESGYTPIYNAIINNKLDALKTIINHDPSILEQRNYYNQTPIFISVYKLNLDAIELILKNSPSQIHQTDSNGDTLLEFSIEKYFKSIEDQKPQEELDKARSIVNLIYKKQLGVEIDPSDEDLKLILDSSKISKHLKLGYADNDFGVTRSENIKIYKEKLENLQSSNPQNPFITSCLKTIDYIDKFDNPIKIKNEKLFIMESGLQNHFTYFIFHVNEENKLTDISYCDGNPVTNPNSLLTQDSRNLRGGVRKFNIESPIEFSEKFVDDFLTLNTRNMKMMEFYNKFKSEGLKLSDATETEPAKYLTNCDFLTPVKPQSKGNCGYKSLKILWRYIAELQNKELDFSSRHPDMIERKLDIAESQSISDSQDRTLMFKELKGDLTISAVEDLIKIKQALKDDSLGEISSNINDQSKKYILEKIDKQLKVVHEKSLKKIEANKGDEKFSKELAIHQRIYDLTKPSPMVATPLLPLVASSGRS